MKYNFSKSTTNLVITLDTESGKYSPEVITVNDPNITLENGNIWLYENGRYLKFFLYNEIGTINGVVATSPSDAFAKINVIISSLIPLQSPIQLKDFYTPVSNVGIVETDLYTYPTEASRLSIVGQKIIAVYGGTFNDATASSRLMVYFGEVLIGDTGALTMSVDIDWSSTVSVIRSGATTAISLLNIFTRGSSTPSYTKFTSISGLTFTNTNIIKITGTASGVSAGSGDITATYGNIIWQPAAV